MTWLFSYGTLQDPEVQRATLGRLLTGMPDELPGFRLGSVAIDARRVVAGGPTHHANAVPSAEADAVIRGMVFEVTDDDLRRFDAYEGEDDYGRTELTLASGRRAWVYAHQPRRAP